MSKDAIKRIINKDLKEIEQLVLHLKGQLTGAIFAPATDFEYIHPLIQAFKSKVGRLLLNDVPTGVEVTTAMTHGGPYPAASDSRFTAVGPASIYRWLRPITYQNWPNELLKKIINNLHSNQQILVCMHAMLVCAHARNANLSSGVSSKRYI